MSGERYAYSFNFLVTHLLTSFSYSNPDYAISRLVDLEITTISYDICCQRDVNQTNATAVVNQINATAVVNQINATAVSICPCAVKLELITAQLDQTEDDAV